MCWWIDSAILKRVAAFVCRKLIYKTAGIESFAEQIGISDY